MNLKEELFDIFNIEEACYTPHIEITRRSQSVFNIEIGSMYESPCESGITFSILKKLSTLFNTEEINVDDYSYGGCESCDYGSDYGHNIQIICPNANVSELEELTKVKNLCE